MNTLVPRALLAFQLLPGCVGFLAPWYLVPGRGRAGEFTLPGALLVGLGGVLLLCCVVEFYRSGRGTLAPWDPPRRLVETGLYRFSRNPMYLAVTLLLWGWAAGFGSGPHAVYAATMMIAFHLRVVLFEEPWLARTFGEAWTGYAARVPRWLGFGGVGR